ncbi:unnamed protein product [Blepharisma stoltei]|uniref:Phosphodiesterase n=1 Tax=Blepharisma stoltei TaxID=1481888 RepID=A0AAU9JBZ6_9CILI|nr:unnamed protein product [Blepharisma stoltei]
MKNSTALLLSLISLWLLERAESSDFLLRIFFTFPLIFLKTQFMQHLLFFQLNLLFAYFSSTFSFYSLMIILISASTFTEDSLLALKKLLIIEISIASIYYSFQWKFKEIIVLVISCTFCYLYSYMKSELKGLKNELFKESEEASRLKLKLDTMKRSKVSENPKLDVTVRKTLIEKLKQHIQSRHLRRTVSISSENSSYTSSDESRSSDDFRLSLLRTFTDEPNMPGTPRSRHAELSENELQDIIQSLLVQELVNWQKKAELSPEDSVKFLEDLQQKYIQSNRDLPGISHRVFQLKKIVKMHSYVEENEALSELLDVGEWDVDLLETVKITKKPIYEVGYYVFSTLGIIEQLNIPTPQLKNFLAEVDRYYKPQNFYHNSIHGADVTCSVVFLLHNCLQRCGNLIDLDIFALLTASLCHDICHPGVNNAFLVASENKLSLKYNDQSCLENMHSSLTFNILKRPNSNIVSSLSRGEFQAYRKIVVLTILATDLQKHFDKQKEFTEQINKTPAPTLENDEFRYLALQMVLKCADLGHGAKRLDIHKKWTALITKEFFEQGEKEKNLGIPISPLCDKSKVVLSKSQVGFLNFLVKPLFKLLETYVVMMNEDEETSLNIKTCCRNIDINIKFWESEALLIDSGQNPTYVLDESPPLLL